MSRNVNLIINTDALVANAPVKTGDREYCRPPVIYHKGASSEQLEKLTGCVRKADPNPFPGALESWKGETVKFALADGSAEVTRIIDSITVKPFENVSPDDLKGTLAEIAMRKMEVSFQEFFQEVHGGKSDAMVIRVHAP